MPPNRDEDFDDEHGLDDDLFEDDDGVDEFDTVACPSCGRLIADDAEWCPHCGQWVIHRPAAIGGRRGVLYAAAAIVCVAGLVLLTTC